ncbi:MAG: hypothetical protein JWM72_1204 [Actinomycetia bacterium]|nr:hypothetical protein [Actinomycetes bacterium]
MERGPGRVTRRVSFTAISQGRVASVPLGEPRAAARPGGVTVQNREIMHRRGVIVAFCAVLLLVTQLPAAGALVASSRAGRTAMTLSPSTRADLLATRGSGHAPAHSKTRTSHKKGSRRRSRKLLTSRVPAVRTSTSVSTTSVAPTSTSVPKPSATRVRRAAFGPVRRTGRAQARALPLDESPVSSKHRSSLTTTLLTIFVLLFLLILAVGLLTMELRKRTRKVPRNRSSWIPS